MAPTRNPIVENPGVVRVSVNSGQFLHFILEAGGPIPIFSFGSDVKGILFEAPDFPGHPLSTYEWDHLKNPSDIQQLEFLQLRLSFHTNANYTYTVLLKDASGVLSTVLQIGYVGTPVDVQPESFTVVIIP
jgi:hypothetical protein